MSISINSKFTIYEHEESVFTVRFSPDSSYLATSQADGFINIFRAINGRELYSLYTNTDLPVVSLRWQPDNDRIKHRSSNVLLSSSANGDLSIWHVSSRDTMFNFVDSENQVFALDYSSDGLKFATGGKDHKIRVYDAQSKQLEQTLHRGIIDSMSLGHSNRIFSLKFHPQDTNMLISGGWDDVVYVWDLRTGETVGNFFGPHICGDTIDISGNIILTGSWSQRKQLQLWDLRNFSEINGFTIEGDKNRSCNLYAAQFSKDLAQSLIAVGGSGYNAIRVFDRLNKFEEVDSFLFDSAVFSLDFSNDARSLAVGLANGTVNVYAVRGLFDSMYQREIPLSAGLGTQPIMKTGISSSDSVKSDKTEDQSVFISDSTGSKSPGGIKWDGIV
eukprot:TRINITY_DN7323_c0_g1_i1.p1 TRINITY_DN7323_c0_g1~~TRINITY_DN7323_c0_g1_i1.p1  ORF type:complete len:388 (-),score=69.92 TRINITY_DN7323_c0_g1_i1:19-1182(-)